MITALGATNAVFLSVRPAAHVSDQCKSGIRMAENMNNGCSQRDSAEHKGYAKVSRSFKRIWKERDSAQPDINRPIHFLSTFLLKPLTNCDIVSKIFLSVDTASSCE